MRVFIDTNLLAYRLDRREATKSERVRGWLAEVIAHHEVVISTQVLIELRSVASRKLQLSRLIARSPICWRHSTVLRCWAPMPI